VKRRLTGAVYAILALTAGAGRAEEVVSPTEIVTVKGAPRTDPGTSVMTVDEAAIARFGATNVGETLERLPSMISGGGARGERILTYRGFGQRQLAIFVDGVPVYVPYDGQLDLAKMPIGTVSRITVVSGASAVLYGPNGIGGAVNITTREPTTSPSLQATSEVSAPRAARGSLVGSAGNETIRGVLAAGFETVRAVPLSSSFTQLPNERGPARTNSDRLDGSVSSKWEWSIADGHRLAVSAARIEGRYGVPPATRDFTVRYWRWTDWASTALGLSHAYEGQAWQTASVAYVSVFDNTLDSYDDARYASQRLPRAFHSIYEDVTVGGFVRSTYSVALDEKRMARLRTWSGVKHDTHASMEDRSADTVAVATNVLTTSALAEVDVVPEWVRASAGVALDGELPQSPPTGAKPGSAAAVGPMAQVGVSPGRDWSLVASAVSRTRFPTLRERFSTAFGAFAPNPDLRAEQAWNLALDAVYKPSSSIRVALGVFDSELADLITTVVVAPQTQQMQNATAARFAGVEGQLAWKPAPWLDLLGGWLAMTVRSEDAQPLAYRPAQKGLVTVTVAPWSPISVGLTGRYVGPQDFQNPDTGVWGRLGGFPLFDARIEWRARRNITAWVRATNLTDANVEARYSFPEAGRQVFLGLSSRLGS
jgi:iron complex outermembrane receptor protein